MQAYIVPTSCFIELNMRESIAKSDSIKPKEDLDEFEVTTEPENDTEPEINDEPVNEVEDNPAADEDGDITEVYEEIVDDPEEDVIEDVDDTVIICDGLVSLPMISRADGRYDDYHKEIAAANTTKLNEIIADSEWCIVRLPAGETYPVCPTIIVDNCTLDLNGSTLYTTEYKAKETLVLLKGLETRIMNGEIVGSYDTPDDDPEYAFFENESLITPAPYMYDAASIINMDIHNCWGYAIGAQGFAPVSVATTYFDPFVAGDEDSDEYKAWTITISEKTARKNAFTELFLTNFLNHEYRYFTAIGNIGYDYIISDRPIKYEFFKYEGDEKKIVYTDMKTPRFSVEIPDEFDGVDITIYALYADGPNGLSRLPRFNIALTDYLMTGFFVEGCKIHNNHSLGMCGGHGATFIRNCKSYQNGRPTADSKHTIRATTGFCDVEDIQTPYLSLMNVESTDEKSLLMDGAYVTHLMNCTGDVLLYRGWETEAVGCTGALCHVGGAQTLKRLYMNNCHVIGANWQKYNQTLTTAEHVVVDGLFDAAQYIDGVECHVPYSTNSYKWNANDTAPRGDIYCENYPNTLRLQLATKEKNPYNGKPTDLRFHITMGGNAGESYGVLDVVGDCYGLTSDTLIAPAGFTIYNSTFVIKDVKTLGVAVPDMAAQRLGGTYTKCKFEIENQAPFRVLAKVAPSIPMQLTFKQCEFDMKNAGIIGSKILRNSVVKFEDCTINGVKTDDMTAEELNAYIFGKI